MYLGILAPLAPCTAWIDDGLGYLDDGENPDIQYASRSDKEGIHA